MTLKDLLEELLHSQTSLDTEVVVLKEGSVLAPDKIWVGYCVGPKREDPTAFRLIIRV